MGSFISHTLFNEKNQKKESTMTEVKINLANMIIHIQGVYDTLREHCKEYITTEKKIEDFSITVTSEEIQNERKAMNMIKNLIII